MYLPEEFYYTKEHEWASVDENVVTVGITEYATTNLGEVIYVDIPEPGQKVTGGETFGSVESVKAVSDLYAPVSGTVIQVNDNVLESTGPINDSPMDEGWLIKIEMDHEKELMNLIRAPEYKKIIEEN